MGAKALARIGGTLVRSARQAGKFIAADICGIAAEPIVGAAQILAYAISLRKKLGLGDTNFFMRRHSIRIRRRGFVDAGSTRC